MLRKGFTLIELLIVITIIAILAGAAIPYVQDYVEDARISRAKADLDEIRNALLRFELDRGVAYLATSTADLVGPYLDKAPIDPWGVPYCITATSSVVFSAGPNRDSGNLEFGGTAGTQGDDVARDFRAPLALSKAYWIDVDKSGSVTANDKIKVRFTRPALVTDIKLMVASEWFIGIKGAAPAVWAGAAMTTVEVASDPYTLTAKEADITITTIGAPVFIPGRDTLSYASAAISLEDSAVSPYGPNGCKKNQVVIQSF
jgi:prepilin-type N-terminal cleavage/methylation domain-containing protein